MVPYGDDAEGNGKKRRRGGSRFALLGNPVYCCVVCALASLFFVVTGIQFWVTPYVIKVIGKPQEDITVAFGLTSITAPIIGVFMGGTIIDKLGGYKGNKALARTLFVCTVNAVLAASSAALTAFVPLAAKDSYVAANASDPVEVAAAADAGATAGFFLTIGLIFATLVFGGAIIPAATGVLVSSVDPSPPALVSRRHLLHQQFGYALVPAARRALVDLHADAGRRAGGARALSDVVGRTRRWWRRSWGRTSSRRSRSASRW